MKPELVTIWHWREWHATEEAELMRLLCRHHKIQAQAVDMTISFNQQKYAQQAPVARADFGPVATFQDKDYESPIRMEGFHALYQILAEAGAFVT